MRYSPQPIEAYGRTIDGKFFGPRNSEILMEDAEAWNLAFLSHDFTRRPEHKDAQFTINVKRTTVTRLDGASSPDLLGRYPVNALVRSLLKKPAPQFVKAIEEGGLYQRLPMFKAYGTGWLDTIRERSWLCATYEDGVDDTVDSLDIANLLLQGFTKKQR